MLGTIVIVENIEMYSMVSMLALAQPLNQHSCVLCRHWNGERARWWTSIGLVGGGSIHAVPRVPGDAVYIIAFNESSFHEVLWVYFAVSVREVF